MSQDIGRTLDPFEHLAVVDHKKPSSFPDRPNGQERGGYVFNKKVINYLNQDIWIGDRLGYNTRITSSPLPIGSLDNNKLIVEVTYDVHITDVLDPHGQIARHKFDDRSVVPRTIIDKACLPNASVYTGNYTRVTARYEYSHEMIMRDYGGVVYLLDLDLVISLFPEDSDSCVHPFSPAGGSRLLESQITEIGNKDSFGMSIVIIDNEECKEPLYVNVLGDVIKIPTTENHSLQSGVYICKDKSNLNRRHMSLKTDYIRYDYEEVIEKKLLFESRYDAQTFGNEELERERNILQLKLETKEREAEAKEREHRRKMEQLERDHNAKSQNNAQESVISIVKFSAALLTAVISISTIIAKNK